jgi:flagellar assembly factor FliW
MYKLRGKILDKKTEEITTKKGETFEKMLFTIRETETGFDHIHQFEIFGSESIAIHQDKLKLDGFATIEFYIKTNEWKGKFFNTLNVKHINLEEQTVNDNAPF